MLYSIDFLVPSRYVDALKRAVSRKWFKTNAPELIYHKNARVFGNDDLRYFTFNADYKQDINYVKSCVERFSYECVCIVA